MTNKIKYYLKLMNCQGLDSEFNTTLSNNPDKIIIKGIKFNYKSGNPNYLETETRMRQNNSMPDGTPINLGLEIIQPIDLNEKIKFVYDPHYPASNLTPAKTELLKEQLPQAPLKPRQQLKMATFVEFFREEIKKEQQRNKPTVNINTIENPPVYKASMAEKQKHKFTPTSQVKFNERLEEKMGRQYTLV